MITLVWRNVADLEPGDIVASVAPRKRREHDGHLAPLAERLATADRVAVVVNRDSSPFDTDLLIRFGRMRLRRNYVADAQLAVVSTSETDLYNLAKLRKTGTPATTTGQEA